MVAALHGGGLPCQSHVALGLCTLVLNQSRQKHPSIPPPAEIAPRLAWLEVTPES